MTNGRVRLTMRKCAGYSLLKGHPVRNPGRYRHYPESSHYVSASESDVFQLVTVRVNGNTNTIHCDHCSDASLIRPLAHFGHPLQTESVKNNEKWHGNHSDQSINMKQAQKDRLQSWANDFDRLLHDPAGLYAFSEFLRTQYCHENVNFWIACENYKLSDGSIRADLACQLYRDHFSPSCTEPVNVDCLAKQAIQEALETGNFTGTTFNSAQYQIFHLMKYDCYPRFLKSCQYQKCWQICDKGKQLPEMNEPFLRANADTGGGEGQLRKLVGSSRMSILPWKNKLTGARERGKKDQDAAQPSTSASSSGIMASADAATLSSAGSKRKQAWRHSKQLSTPTEPSHSGQRSSSSMEALHPLTSSILSSSQPPDVVPRPDPPPSPSPGPYRRTVSHSQTTSPRSIQPASPLAKRSAPQGDSDTRKFSCTLILASGGERRRVEVSQDLTVRRWLHELAMEYGLNAAATDVIDDQTDQPLDLASNASRVLAGKTVRLEGGVVFKVDLPWSMDTAGHTNQRRLLAVKARSDSTAGQVLRPILNKYGLVLDCMVICVAGTNEVLPNHSAISLANNKKLLVLTQQEFEEWVHGDHDSPKYMATRSTLSPSFDDIVGAKYFQELPSQRGIGIAELAPEWDLSKAGPSKKLSVLKLVKRGAVETIGKQTKPFRLSFQPQQHSSANVTNWKQTKSTGKKSTVSKQELLELAKDEKRLAALLDRAQASSFDDQRGSRVKNFDLPDFLKAPDSDDPAALVIKSSSLDDRLDGERGLSGSSHCRPTDLVHRKLCDRGGPVDAHSSASDTGDEDNFDSDRVAGTSYGLPKCVVSIHHVNEESKIPSHEEAERLFGGTLDRSNRIDFGDPSMTERRRLSDFGFNTNDSTVRSGWVAVDYVAGCQRGSQQFAPRDDTAIPSKSPGRNKSGMSSRGASSTSDLASLVDQEKKAGGICCYEEDWQVGYV